MIHARGKISFLIRHFKGNIFVLDARNLVGKRIIICGKKTIVITYVSPKKGIWIGESK